MVSGKVVVGAHYGLKDWLAQRVTAVVMALYSVWMFGVLLVSPPNDFAAWRGLFSHSGIKAATFVFLVSLFWHAWIGVRDIFMDYIQPTGLRLMLQVLAIVVLMGYAGWSIQILWSI
jgi:succinate dehydrogenase / fumarate reductase, membrane anchor subunit